MMPLEASVALYWRDDKTSKRVDDMKRLMFLIATISLMLFLSPAVAKVVRCMSRATRARWLCHRPATDTDDDEQDEADESGESSDRQLSTGKLMTDLVLIDGSSYLYRAFHALTAAHQLQR